MNYKNRKKNILHGGFITGTENDTIHFIENSTFSLLSDSSSFGIIFVATLNPGNETNLKYMDLDNFGKPVTNMLIKLSFIHDGKLRVIIPTISKRTVFIDDFINEVNIQTELFYKSYQYLQPICPAILSALTIQLPLERQVKNLSGLLAILYLKNDDIKTIIDIIMTHDNVTHIGIIAMEYADGYDLLYNCLEEDRKAIEKYKKKNIYIYPKM